MLSEAEKDYVTEVLIDWVAPVEKPREIVIDAVRLCLVDAWNNDPPWLVLLLNILPVGVINPK